MCMDEIGQVRAIDRDSGMAFMATEEREHEISLLAMDEPDEVRAGDWIVVYQGYALHVLDEAVAAEMLRDRAAARGATAASASEDVEAGT